MKGIYLFLMIFIATSAFSQQIIEWGDDFSDGDFTQNPAWSGISDNFIVNSDKQLQSNAKAASRSFLTTPSQVFEEGVWEFWVRINYNPTSQNYAAVYIIADRDDLSGDVNGYYVQIGNTAKEISLYRQEGSKRTKIIDGEDQILNMNPVVVKVKVTRSDSGEFKLYRQRFSANGEAIDVEFIREGEAVTDNVVTGSSYLGLLYVNSGATGKNFLFDDIFVRGKKFLDTVPPVLTSIEIMEPNQLLLGFSEAVDISGAEFELSPDMGFPATAVLTHGDTQLTLSFDKNIESGKVYILSVKGVKDLSGNLMEDVEKEIALLEQPEEGDLIINEILFDVSSENAEFIEVYNHSGKILDLSKVFYGTRGSGVFKPSNYFPSGTYLLPGGHLAVTADRDLVTQFYPENDTARIVQSERWSALNNSGAQLLLGVVTGGDTIFLDEVHYEASWHHILVKSPKNVSLERIHPELPSNSPDSWHSAASEVAYATPGFKNSQYYRMDSELQDTKKVWVEPEVFSPDNDGIDDVCFIRYQTDSKAFNANVIIFNPVGVQVRKIASNALLSSEGYFTWDGLTDRGLNVNPGIYVLYFEMINVETGVKKVEKLPLVVSAR